MRKILHAAVAAALLAVPAQAGSVSDPYTSFFVLGDSLSDNGSIIPQPNWLFATGGAPYFDRPDLPLNPFSGLPDIEEGGTFTNGDVWSQPITDDFLANGKLTVNFANGGATTGTLAGPAGLDLSTQAQAAAFNPFKGSRPLASVWFGGNDILGAYFAAGGTTGTDFSGMAMAATAAATNIFQQMGFMNAFGIRDFIVPLMPDLGLTPRFITTAEPLLPGIAAIATAATDTFNNTLIANMALLRASGANISIIDVNSLLKDAAANPGSYGYNNVTDACVTPSATCANVAEYLFIDDVHPTAGAHAIIGQQAVAALTPVPLPAGAWLLLGGLGLLAARRRSAA
jgi:phospholipase/lecithinase/hemolysin